MPFGLVAQPFPLTHRKSRQYGCRIFNFIELETKSSSSFIRTSSKLMMVRFFVIACSIVIAFKAFIIGIISFIYFHLICYTLELHMLCFQLYLHCTLYVCVVALTYNYKIEHPLQYVLFHFWIDHTTNANVNRHQDVIGNALRQLLWNSYMINIEHDNIIHNWQGRTWYEGKQNHMAYTLSDKVTRVHGKLPCTCQRKCAFQKLLI